MPRTAAKKDVPKSMEELVERIHDLDPRGSACCHYGEGFEDAVEKVLDLITPALLFEMLQDQEPCHFCGSGKTRLEHSVWCVQA